MTHARNGAASAAPARADRDDMETDDGNAHDCDRYEQCSDDGADRCWHCGRARAQHPRPRSGKHTSPRLPPVSVEPELLAQIDAECEESAISRTDWVREAVRAYLILSKRDRLTDADWRRVVSGF